MIGGALLAGLDALPHSRASARPSSTPRCKRRFHASPAAQLLGGQGADSDHRSTTGVDRFDDLGVVDALQIDRGDAEVAVPELALDDDQRHAFAGHLDRVGIGAADAERSVGARRLALRPVAARRELRWWSTGVRGCVR
jgi:hypothetical protein